LDIYQERKSHQLQKISQVSPSDSTILYYYFMLGSESYTEFHMVLFSTRCWCIAFFHKKVGEDVDNQLSVAESCLQEDAR